MEKKSETENLSKFDFTKAMIFDEEIYSYSESEYNTLLEAKPWKKE